MNRVVGEILPDPDGMGLPAYGAVRNTYDAAGRLIKIEKGQLGSWQSDTLEPSAWSGFTVYESTETTWDVLDHKLTELKRTGSSGEISTLIQYSYDVVGRPECTAVRMNKAVFATPPASACALGTQGIDGPDRITKNVYDAAGQLVQVIQAYGVTTENGFAQTLQAAVVNYAYDSNGKQTDMTDAKGNHAQFVYDGFDRQIAWIFPSKDTVGAVASCNLGAVSQSTYFLPDGNSLSASGPADARSTGDDCEKYFYDANSNRVRLVKRDGSILSYEHDKLNRIVGKFVDTNTARPDLPASAKRAIYYVYDLQNNQTAARFDSLSGEGVTNAFDGLGRQTSSSLTMDGVTRTVSFFHDANGNRTRMTYPDGNYVTYAYDRLDRPSLILRSGNASTPIASYAYDAAGRRKNFNGGVSTSFDYDGIGRLASLTNAPNASGGYSNTYGFGYNPASQITSLSKSNNSFVFKDTYNVNRGYNANGLNQYTSAGQVIFHYDDNGNLTDDASTSFTYDVENRLVAAAGAKQAQMRYDPLGRLYEISSSSGTTHMFYNSDELIGEYDASGNLLRRYVHGADLKSDDPIAWYEGSGFDSPYERFLRPDWQGSIALVTDNAGSAVYATNTFDEYGIPGSSNTGRFQYTGQAWMPELGMYYYKARFYSPTLGRFMQTDPIGYRDQVNLYAYVGNDPMDNFDPSGGQCTQVGDYQETCSTPPPRDGTLALQTMKAPTLINNPRPKTQPQSNNDIIVNGQKDKPFDWGKFGSCLGNSALDHYGLGGAAAASSALAVPIPKAIVPPYRVIGSKTTNLLSVLGHFAEVNVPRVTIGGLGSTNLLRIAGRANPYVAAGLLAVDAAVIGYDTYQCYTHGGG